MATKLPVRCENSHFTIPVYPERLTVNYTIPYIQQIDPSLSNKEAKAVLYWMGKTYNEVEGINEAVIKKLIQGVQSGLL